MSLTFGELFAGVGGFSLGFEQAGWECRWQVEWDKHCQQVLARHWPEVPRYGDVQTVAGGDIPLAGRHDNELDSVGSVAILDGEQGPRSVLAPVDCITFGSPCQDLSIAGKRAGLDGARSGLFYEAIRIIKEMRNATNGAFPRIAIWENVAGALSSNKGDDFLAVIDAFAEIGALDIAWRLVDAQHFGVAQRRRRVFVVADFGGECAGSIHLEPAGVRWHSATSRAPGKGAAGGIAVGLGGNGSVAGPLGGGNTGGHRGDLDSAGAYIVQPVQQGFRMTAFGQYADDDLASAMKQRDYKDATDLVVQQTFPIQSTVIGRADTAGPHGPGYGHDGDPMFTLDRAGAHAVAVAQNQRGELVETDYAHSLSSSSGGKPGEGYAAARIGGTVRRLSPLECERLMGWPDFHTRWRADGTEQSDSQRYRQCGNGVVATVAAWLAWNLKTALEEESAALPANVTHV